jgi:hypothetical protein
VEVVASLDPEVESTRCLPLDGLLISRARSVHKFLVIVKVVLAAVSSVKEFTGTGGFLRFEVNETGVVMCSEL